MAVTNIIARLYDAGTSKTSSQTTAATDSSFAETVQAAVDEKTSAEATEKTSVKETATKTCCCCEKTDDDTEVNKSAMFRFSMFIRVSSDFGAVQDSMIDKFKEATKSFVESLKKDEKYDLPVLDGYLGKADEAAASGLENARSFLDSILSSADNGLKSISSSLTGSSWMSGLNSSSTSNGFASTSLADIALLQLQNALYTTSAASTGATSSSSAETVTYSSGHKLELVKGPSLATIDANSGGFSGGMVSAADSSAGTTKAATDDSSTSTASDVSVLSTRDRILDRFLQFLDGLSSGSATDVRVVKAGFSFSYSGSVVKESMEAGKANGDVSTDTADADEKVVV